MEAGAEVKVPKKKRGGELKKKTDKKRIRTDEEKALSVSFLPFFFLLLLSLKVWSLVVERSREKTEQGG